MTKEELIDLETKIKNGKATEEELSIFFKEIEAQVEDLHKYISTLPKI
jgi:hypothetical protein